MNDDDDFLKLAHKLRTPVVGSRGDDHVEGGGGDAGGGGGAVRGRAGRALRDVGDEVDHVAEFILPAVYGSALRLVAMHKCL